MVERICNTISGDSPDCAAASARTSMLGNGAKGHWTLEELGWRRHSPGSLHAWDGLLGWFMTYVSEKTSVLEQRFIKQWHSAAQRALENYEPQGDLPSSLRPSSGT
ncbi:MAG: hypothetical protein OXG91_09930 [bacterium]|nr:hypothetical protein [bacterium]